MPKFKVLSPIKHDGEEYAPGETIELTAKQAAAMPWAVTPAGSHPERAQQVEGSSPSTAASGTEASAQGESAAEPADSKPGKEKK